MKKFKIGLIIILIFAALAIVAYFLIQKYTVKPAKAPECETGQATTCKVDLKDASTVQATKTTVGSFDDKAKITSNIYKNDKFKFQITFNDSWKNAQIKETVPGTASEGIIEFQMPTTDKTFADGYASALVITIYKKDSFKPSSNFEMRLAENPQYVVSYRAWEQPPIDSKISEKEIANIAATFKFTN